MGQWEPSSRGRGTASPGDQEQERSQCWKLAGQRSRGTLTPTVTGRFVLGPVGLAGRTRAPCLPSDPTPRGPILSLPERVD